MQGDPLVDAKYLVRRPGEARALWVLGDRYEILAGAEETDGRLTIIENTIYPGGGPPPHVHSREAEAFYILDGALEFEVESETVRADAGSFVYLPAGTRHTFRTADDRPVKALVLITPAGLERFFGAIGEPASEGSTPTPPGPETFQRVLSLAPEYGLDIHPPRHD